MTTLPLRKYTQRSLDSSQKSDYVQMQAVMRTYAYRSLFPKQTELILLAPSVGATNTYPMTTDKLYTPVMPATVHDTLATAPAPHLPA
ncbi:MAG: hypothetical protein AAFN40_22025 [Cyanobacteria bacterium J06560_6]